MTLRRLLIVVLAATLALGGCTHYRTQGLYLIDYDNNRAKYKYNVEITADDGTKIRFTVYQPAMRREARAPLIIHAHGFALTRMKHRVGLYGSYLLAGEAAIEAWDRGYFVISYDQRGHGASGGKIRLLDKDKEVADVSRIIDWAEANLALARRGGDPLVGMIGESYGGGVQLLASVQDKRIDALVPITTWYDLEDALLPNGVAKSDWLMFLGGVGYLFNPFHMDSSVTGPMTREVLFDKPQPALRARLRQNSLASHCSGDEMPHADALIIHGFRDSMFPMNQGLAIRDCFRRSGRDARLIAIEHGHLAPTAQLSPGLPVWYAPDTVSCGGRVLDFRDVVVSWYDAKLRGKTGKLSMVPSFCFIGDETNDATGEPPPSDTFTVPATPIGSGVSGLFEWAARPLQSFGNSFVADRTPDDWMNVKEGGLRPARIPLLRAAAPLWIAGTPTASIDITDTDRDDATVFLRLAAWKPGAGNYRVLSQQVTPVRGAGHHEIPLNAVRAKVMPDEIVGLLVQGYSNQFRLTGSGFGTDATVGGTISLPLAGGKPVTREEGYVQLEEKRRAAEEAKARAEAQAAERARRKAAGLPEEEPAAETVPAEGTQPPVGGERPMPTDEGERSQEYRFPFQD